MKKSKKNFRTGPYYCPGSEYLYCYSFVVQYSLLDVKTKIHDFGSFL